MSIRLRRTDILSSTKYVEYENKKNEKTFDKRMNEQNCAIKSKINEDIQQSYYQFKSNDKQYIDSQFNETSVEIPMNGIILAVILFLLGSSMIVLGSLMLTDYIETQHRDRSWPIIFIGLLIFLPGFYHIRIAYWAWMGDENFSYSDIPDLDW